MLRSAEKMRRRNVRALGLQEVWDRWGRASGPCRLVLKVSAAERWDATLQGDEA